MAAVLSVVLTAKRFYEKVDSGSGRLSFAQTVRPRGFKVSLKPRFDLGCDAS